MGRRLGRRLAVVEYAGRRTGRRHQLVTQYVTEGSTVRITVGMADRKTWWRNFEVPHAVRLRLAGVERDTLARVVHEGNRVSVLADVEQPVVSGSRGTATAQRGGALAWVLLLLALGMAAASLLGPVGVGAMTYRTSPTSLNQLRGSDAATLFLLAPLTLGAAALAWRRHSAAPLLGAGIGAYALYTYTQVVVGQEYLRLPGNVEKFFPLLLVVFVLAGAAVVLGQRATPAVLPRLSPRMARVMGVVLLCLAAFLVLGLHLPSMVTAWQEPSSMTEYASSPTPFWLVKLMDLGIIVPVAVVTGIGMLRGAPWAARVMYPLLTAYACLGTSVASMALVMVVRDDPDASLTMLGGFLGFAFVFAVLTAAAYRPLFRSRTEPGRTLRAPASLRQA
jgi:hypothetical protein